MEIIVGTKAEVGALVEREDTAKEVGSGDLLVYATPCMAALMEGAACEALEGMLDEGKTTVGTALSIEHISATPVGLEVRAEAEITAVEGRSSPSPFTPMTKPVKSAGAPTPVLLWTAKNSWTEPTPNCNPSPLPTDRRQWYGKLQRNDPQHL